MHGSQNVSLLWAVLQVIFDHLSVYVTTADHFFVILLLQFYKNLSKGLKDIVWKADPLPACEQK